MRTLKRHTHGEPECYRHGCRCEECKTGWASKRQTGVDKYNETKKVGRKNGTS
jgi:hypothetical protein